MNNKEERMLTCVPPWKHSGEMNDLTFDQYPGGEPAEDWQSEYEDGDKRVDKQMKEVQVEEVEPLRPTKQDANSDRILRDGDEMDGYGDEGANNVMRDVCEPSDGREEACPTVTA
eukprot:CAMPEP_0204090448 /NCGR_PEP_ID=MMETSP0360-20130528/188908_1 /ASSEMBLY_ACC=CAM_ASM_000342 /TAXON_ID=268821 /ORGANISM="Scrippsiella Hangoei, Strain SHTV-5" /LENGTH=114 /DNA_ID=CAMNT_0051039707 /DNA_START=510 /DNA_END=852 /DNA_ORIENTATION=-